MKAKFLILTALALFITINMKAQRYIAITLHEGTDSAMVIMASNEIVIVSTKDSTAILRRYMVDIEGFPQKKQSRRKSKYYELQKLYSFSGKIVEWRYNDNFICNGFLLQSEKETRLIKFNPTLGAAIKSLDENVEVIGTLAKSKNKGNKMMGLVQIHDRKDTIYKSMNPVFHKVLLDSANAISSSGKIKEVEYCGWYIRRCVLEDNVVLRFPGY